MFSLRSTSALSHLKQLTTRGRPQIHKTSYTLSTYKEFVGKSMAKYISCEWSF